MIDRQDNGSGRGPVSAPTTPETTRMKRTRRAALATIAGSSGVLAIETMGFSTAGLERDAQVRTAGDANAYLGLTADGVEEGGVLFEGDPRQPPTTFDVINQLTEPIAVTLTVEHFRFRSADGNPVSDDRVIRRESANERLGPGERIADVTVGLDPERDGTGGETVTGTIGIEAAGDETTVEAERELTLERPEIAIDSARLEVTQTGGGVFEHAWSLSSVDTDGAPLERLRFDYGRIETTRALDFTGADALSASVAIDGSEHAATIERRTPETLDLALESPVSIDHGTVEIVLTNTGPPASPGGGNRSPSGAVLELQCGGASARVEGIWRRP